MTLVTSVLAVVLMFLSVLLHEYLTYQPKAIASLETKAKMVAANLAPLVAANNKIFLQQSMPMLAANHDLLAVMIVDIEREPIANFQVSDFVEIANKNTVKFEFQLLSRQRWVGDIELYYRLPVFLQQIEDYYFIALLSVFALIIMLLMQRYFFRKLLDEPLKKLAKTIRSSTVVQEYDSDNEFLQLEAAFESLRDQAEQQQQDLETANSDLHKRGVQLEQELEDRIQAEKRLTFIARHDVLTGLPNRAAFDLRLDELLLDAHEENHTHVLLYMDLDQFKVVNDTCGHVAGDHLLRQITEILKNDIRQGDILARLGGDEFGVLLPYCGIKVALKIAHKMRQTVMDFRFTWQDKTFSIGISIGMVPITPDSESREALLSLADALCYTAKDNGRNCVEVYQGETQGNSNRQAEMHWVSRLNDAMEEKRIVLMYQPIQAITGDDLKDHYEILIRLQQANGELIAPGAFLPAAERYNLMPRLDRYVVESTLEWLSRHPEHLKNLGMCSINLSGNSLGDKEFLEFIITKLTDYSIPADKICFEITETMAVQTFNNTIVFMEHLKKLGCKFALDDFGSGFSSYAYLKNLPVDFLKIDGAFVRDIADDRLDRSMVKSINEIGHVMGKKTIAEYVESAEILSFLFEIGVDYAQGFYIGKPEPLDNVLLNADRKKK